MKALGFLVCAALALFLIYNAIRHFIINQKSKLIGLLRKVPLLPFPLDGITELEPTEQLKTLVPQARIQVGPEYTSRQECWNGRKHAIDKMNEIMRWIVKYNRKGTEMVVDDHEKIEDLIPKETKLVSISMERFKHGRLCHEFEPVDGMSSGSYYTFQMFGDNKIQVTNYVEEGVSYVAGFCIYIQNPWLSGNHFREKVVEDCFASKKLPIRVRTSRVIVKNEHQVQVQKNPSAPTKEKNETTYLFSDCQEPSTSYREGSPVPSEVSLEEQTIRYCPKLQRKVMSKVEASVVIHEEWDPQLREMKNKECEMCTDVLNNEYPPPYSSLAVR